MPVLINPYSHASGGGGYPAGTQPAKAPHVWSWYDLDDGNDASSTQHLTEKNGVTFPATGLVGNAMLCDIATNRYLEYLVTPANKYSGNDMTLGAWVKDARTLNPTNGWIICNYNSATTSMWLCRIINGYLEWRLYYSSNNYDEIVSTVQLSLTGWDFIMVGRDSSRVGNELFMYVNGEDVVEGAATGTVFTTATPNFTIGGRTNGTGIFDGLIDSAFSDFNRAMTNDNRWWLFNGGLGRQWSDFV